MNIDIKLKKRQIVVCLDGEIDHHTSEMIRCVVDNEINLRAPVDVEFNLDGVDFMDSSGIGILMGRYKKLSALGGKLSVTNARPQIKRMLDMSGITRLVEVR